MLKCVLRPAYHFFRRSISRRPKQYSFFPIVQTNKKKEIMCPCQLHVDCRKRIEAALTLNTKSKDEEEEIKLIVVKAPPGASETSVPGKIEWTKTVGTHVKVGELVCRIRFKEGRSLDITAPVEGVIAIRNKRENDSVHHGDELFKIRLGPAEGKRVLKKIKLKKKNFLDFDEEDMNSLLDSGKGLHQKTTHEAETTHETKTNQDPKIDLKIQKPSKQQNHHNRYQNTWSHLIPQNREGATLHPIPPMMTAMDEINIESALKFLSNYDTSIFMQKPTMLSIYIKAAAFVLKMKPALNISVQNKVKIQKPEIDIAIAVRHLKALAFHKFESVDKTSYFDIDRVIFEIKKQMSEGTYRQGRTPSLDFTISQEWQLGSVFGTPYHSGTCTLGIHQCITRPTLIGTQIISAPMMYVSLTYNNSLINDKDVVDFLKVYKLAIEEPRYILVNKD